MTDRAIITTTGNNPFTGKTSESVMIPHASIETVKQFLMQQRQIIMMQEERGDRRKTHMVITGVRDGHNKPIPDQMQRSFTVVGFSILPDNYGELITTECPREIHVTDCGVMDIRDVRRINHYHKIAAVKWLSVLLRNGVRTAIKAHDMHQNAEGLFYYKIPGEKRQWHGTHFIIEPQETKAVTRMRLRQHYDQLLAYKNPLEQGSLIQDKQANEYLVLNTFDPREIGGKVVDMMIVNGNMAAPIYAFSFEFEIVRDEV